MIEVKAKELNIANAEITTGNTPPLGVTDVSSCILNIVKSYL